jgi:hypothetical protein
MRQQSTKCQWQIEKPLKFTGRFGYGRKKYSGFHFKKLTTLTEKMGKNTHNTTKNKVHIVYFFNLIICPVVRVFPLESLVYHLFLSY